MLRTLIAVPCMDMVHTVFMKSLLKLIKVGDCEMGFTVSSLIYDARNLLAGQAVTEGYDRVLWLDSDMVFAPDLLAKLSADMDEGRELVTAIAFRRKPPFKPCIFNELEYNPGDENIDIKLTTYEDYPKDSIFPIAACGLAGCMMSTDLISRIGNKFGAPFTPLLGMGEDLSFCYKASQLGVELFCDSRVKMGHVGSMTVTEQTYLSMR